MPNNLLISVRLEKIWMHDNRMQPTRFACG